MFLAVKKTTNIILFSMADYLSDVYGNMAMANYPYENSFLAPLPAYPVTQFCSYLNESLNDTQLIHVSFV